MVIFTFLGAVLSIEFALFYCTIVNPIISSWCIRMIAEKTPLSGSLPVFSKGFRNGVIKTSFTGQTVHYGLFLAHRKLHPLKSKVRIYKT